MDRAPRHSFRWVVLGVGTAAQAVASAVVVAVVVLSSGLQAKFGLSLGQLGVVLAAVPAGGVLSTFVWGLLTDRLGERTVLVAGLSLAGVCLLAAGAAETTLVLVGSLAGAGFGGASVGAATGRAVMQWFEPRERGFALGLRQAAVPLGGFVAALSVAPLGIEGAMYWLAAVHFAAAVLVGSVVRDRPGAVRSSGIAGPSRVLRDPGILRLCLASALLSTAQVCLLGFSVVLLREVGGLQVQAAGLCVASMQLAGVVICIASGRASDRRGERIRPLVQMASLLSFLCVATGAAILIGSAGLVVALLLVTGAVSLGWNALSFTLAAEAGGEAHSGSAIGMQQTALGLWAAAVPSDHGLASIRGTFRGLAFSRVDRDARPPPLRATPRR